MKLRKQVTLTVAKMQVLVNLAMMALLAPTAVSAAGLGGFCSRTDTYCGGKRFITNSKLDCCIMGGMSYQDFDYREDCSVWYGLPEFLYDLHV